MSKVMKEGYSRSLKVHLTNEPGLVRKYRNRGLLQNCLYGDLQFL